MRLGTQVFAAFGAAACENSDTTFGGHARAEAVTAFANQFTGLISPFHIFTPI